MIHTLRFRLAAWCALVLALVLAAFGALLYGTVRYQLVRHHDAQLDHAAQSVEQILSEQPDCEQLTAEQQQRLDRIGPLVLFHEVEGAGRVFYRSPVASSLPIAVDQHAVARAGSGGWFETVSSGRAPLRIYSKPYRARSGRRGLIHVGQELGDVVAPLASLRMTLLLMAPLAMLVSAIGGYWLAGRALSPVDEVTRLAREIEASSLSRRLPAPKAQDEIGRLVDTFNQMIGRLESSFESMKRFTADASHELRGPLATMRGTIDVTLARERAAAEYGRVLESLGEDVDRLRSIVEDLLVLARADAGRIALEKSPVRLDILASEVAESFAAAASESGLSLSAGCGRPVLVLGDERWLRQLVFNIVENAVKFAAASIPRSGTPGIRLEVAAANGRATLSVSDSGPGVPEEALGLIFERFYRADTARTYRGPEGSGLGLSIAAWIVDAHEGTIRAENPPEGGSRFTVTLAAMASEASHAAEELPEPPT